MLVRADRARYDRPNSIGTITALVHGADGWGPEQVLTSHANVGLIRPFLAKQ